jgi:phosphoheptose isomerase
MKKNQQMPRRRIPQEAASTISLQEGNKGRLSRGPSIQNAGRLVVAFSEGNFFSCGNTQWYAQWLAWNFIERYDVNSQASAACLIQIKRASEH